MFDSLIQFIREQYNTNELIPLHAPLFIGKEREYVLDSINSSFVSSVGQYVNQFENSIANYTQSPAAVVTVNGTSALHMALLLAGVTQGDYVLTQALSFVATANAICYCHASPVFIDVEKNTLGLSPVMVDAWLEEHAYLDDQGQCRKKSDHRPIRACVPMHTFGHPVNMDDLIAVCRRWHLWLVEDAAESLGSFYKEKHTGTLGDIGVLSFNGNKLLTTGGGGMILTNSTLGKRAKHLTTTAKRAHAYEFYHDELGYNYRMPNLNAAIGCAQLEQLELFIASKRQLAARYDDFFAQTSLKFIREPANCRSNYWLNAVLCQSREERDELLKTTNEAGIMTRPIWQPLDTLPFFKGAPSDHLATTKWLSDRIVNLPSSVIVGDLNA